MNDHDDDQQQTQPDQARAAMAAVLERVRQTQLQRLRRDGDGYSCPACGEPVDVSGWPACQRCEVEAERAEQQREAATVARERWLALRVQLPPMQWAHAGNKAWVARIAPEIVAALRSWTPRPPTTTGPQTSSLLLVGPTGCGKTSALAARLRRLAREQMAVPAPWFPVAVWATEERLERAKQYGQHSGPLIDRARAADLLVIDELGQGQDHRLAFGLLHDRYERGAATVITSGMAVGELSERYSDAFLRRLTDTGRVVDCHG